MILVRHILEGGFRSLKFQEDIIYGRYRNFETGGDEGIFFIECFAADGAYVTASTVVDRAGNGIEDGVSDFLELIAFDF